MSEQALARVGGGEGYGFSRTLSIPIEQALERVRAALKDEGFGVLTEIDMKDKFKEKLGVDFRKYVILGACNPPIAHKVLGEELALGLLLPCNVIAYEENGATVVAVIDAVRMMSVVDNPSLAVAAAQVNEKLKRAIVNM